MATATVNGQKHRVRVTRDLTDNYAIEVYPEPEAGAVKIAEPFKPWPVPLTMKVMADTAEDALQCALETMQKKGKISSFEIPPEERPKPPAPKAAGAAAAKDKDDDAEDDA
jgi:hypothetical protein